MESQPTSKIFFPTCISYFLSVPNSKLLALEKIHPCCHVKELFHHLSTFTLLNMFAKQNGII